MQGCGNLFSLKIIRRNQPKKLKKIENPARKGDCFDFSFSMCVFFYVSLQQVYVCLKCFNNFEAQKRLIVLWEEKDTRYGIGNCPSPYTQKPIACDKRKQVIANDLKVISSDLKQF